jgi:hypothetical protein
MYYWLKEKLGDNWFTRAMVVLIYTLLILLILLYSVFPSDTFRYMEI